LHHGRWSSLRSGNANCQTKRHERDVRRVRAREMFARVAGFPTVKTLDGFDFGFATGVLERVNDFDTAGGRSLGSEFWFL
jgi:hypothetical protein